MKCHKCGKQMKYAHSLKFNNYELGGWVCSCGETYYNPEQAERILLLNKLKKKGFKLKLNTVKSNQIIRLPKQISELWYYPKEIDLRLIEKDRIIVEPIPIKKAILK